jgi:protein TonB
MKPIKTDNANLENKRFLFFQLGIIAALLLVLTILESSTLKESNELVISGSDYFEDDYIPNVKLKKPLPPAQAPPKPVDLLVIKSDDQIIKDPLVLDDMQAWENMIFNLPVFPDEKSVADDDYVFQRVEDMPKFYWDNSNDFKYFIAKHLKYPKIAKINGIQGIVRVRFIIDEKGNLINAEIIRSVDQSLDEEVLRVLNLSPRWIPGKQRGKPVKVSFEIPVNFRLGNF